MSDNASSVLPSVGKLVVITDNQQGSRSDFVRIDPSETTRRPPQIARVIKAYMQGALHDGTFSRNKRFRISQKGTEWLCILRQMLKRIDYNSWLYQEGKERNIYVLETLANFLDFHFNPLQLKTKAEKIAYIQGFFDAEGGVPHDKRARFYIQLTQKDKTKIAQLKVLLDSLKIYSGKIHNPSKRVDPNYWRIFISARSHYDFIKIIGTSHPMKRKILAQRVMI